jgi:hypothetical protein
MKIPLSSRFPVLAWPGRADEEQGIPAYRSSDSRARGILEAHDFSLSPSAPDHLSPEYSLIKPGNDYGKDPCAG